MDNFYKQEEEIDDFTKHFIDCYESRDEKKSDFIEDDDYKKLNDLLNQLIAEKENEKFSTKMMNYFGDLVTKCLHKTSFFKKLRPVKVK